MKTSLLCLNKIVEFEGMKLEAYLCPAGVWTIGAGHTKGVARGQKITKEKAMEYLRSDVLPIENYINARGWNLNQNQFDALVDFMFNMGIANFMKSSLRKAIVTKAGNDEVCRCFRMWNKARVNGKFQTLQGLVKRREWECSMWVK